MVIAGIVIGTLVLILLIFRLMWRVAEPNEALIISGLREHDTPDGVGESLGNSRLISLNAIKSRVGGSSSKPSSRSRSAPTARGRSGR